MNTQELINKWYRDCIAASGDIDNYHEPRIEAAEGLLALARHIHGVACPLCSGYGKRAYSSTSTWKGGMGGTSITTDVCDKCWGSGRTDETGPDLRKIKNELEQKERVFKQEEFEQWLAKEINLPTKTFNTQVLLEQLIQFLQKESNKRKLPEGVDNFFYRRSCEYLVSFFQRLVKHD